MAPWFDTQEEVFACLSPDDCPADRTGEVDPYAGGSDIWHTALLVRDRSFRMLMPFAEYPDVLDLPQRHSDEQLALARESLVEASRALLADEAFWP